MSEATDAILDILDGLEDFGTNVTLKRVVSGTYNPATGETADTITSYPMKAFIGKFASQKIANSPLITTSGYDSVFKIYHTEDITKEWLVSYGGFDYTILVVDSTVIQDENILFELVCKK